MQHNPYHTFHIPVMGLAFTVDSPVKVAPYGISSVISIVEDKLLEMMRSYYYPFTQQVYFPIPETEDDFRAKRITDYLNLVNTIVQEKVEKIKKSAFETGSDIAKYFEMLPDDSKLKQMYNYMMNHTDPLVKQEVETYLREQIIPGSIDVNIMTKTDRNKYNDEGQIVEDQSDAVSALRGYAKSDLENSSVVFSAGMNPRLYNYLEKCPEFNADENGQFKKKVIIKVSDYRSALIQGKFLAKKGIWVSEFRVESGLNCGGHAFATDGYLMGPILEEFKTKKEELVNTLFEIYNAAIRAKGKPGFSAPHRVKLTAQGGIGTYEEDLFLREHYGVESTGWGTPFLLVPEATTVDTETLNLLSKSKKEDLMLSYNSPLGVRFHYLKGTSSDLEKKERAAKGKPGSPCTEKFLAFNTEFTEEPICTASHKYQKLKIQHLQSLHLSEEEYRKQLAPVLEKECLCVGLSNAAAHVYDVPFVKKQEAVTVCPGPNIANFSRVVSLRTMVDHIYGRANIMTNPAREHMFITEIALYIQYLKEQLAQDEGKEPDAKRLKFYQEYYNNMMDGIAYYRELVNEGHFNPSFAQALNDAEFEIDTLRHIALSESLVS